MDKEDVVEICNALQLSHKRKNESLPFTAMWLDLESIRLREINQRKINTVPRLVKERGRWWAEAFYCGFQGKARVRPSKQI